MVSPHKSLKPNQSFSIGEYSAKKLIFSPVGEKIVKKIPHIFHFQKWEIFRNCTFWGKKVSKLAFLGENCKNRVKSIKICTFWGKSFPSHLFFPPLLLFGRIFTYVIQSKAWQFLASWSNTHSTQNRTGHENENVTQWSPWTGFTILAVLQRLFVNFCDCEILV